MLLIIEVFTGTITRYFESMDVEFCFTFLILTYVVNRWINSKNEKIASVLASKHWLCVLGSVVLKTRYRVFVVGTLYGGLIYVFRGYSGIAPMEQLFKAFLFGMVLYSLVLDIPIKWVESLLKNYAKKKIEKEFIEEEIPV